LLHLSLLLTSYSYVFVSLNRQKGVEGFFGAGYGIINLRNKNTRDLVHKDVFTMKVGLQYLFIFIICEDNIQSHPTIIEYNVSLAFH